MDFIVDQIDFQTEEESLFINITGHIASSQTTAFLSGDCSVFENLNEECTLEVGTTPFSLMLDLQMSLDDGEFVVNVDQPVFEITNITNPISDCLVSDAVDTLLGQDPALVSNAIADIMVGELDHIPFAVESSLNNTIQDLSIHQTVDLLGQGLDVQLAPTIVELNDNGVIVGFGSVLTIDVEETCVDINSFEAPEEVPWPIFDGKVFDSDMEYDAGLFLGRHFLDQFFYAVWASGAMCLDVSEQTGLALTGELASGLFSEELGDLLGEEALDLRMVASAPFVTMFSDDQPPLSVVVDEVALIGYGPIDQRLSRLLQVDINSELGVSIELEGNALTLELPLDAEQFFFQESYHEILSSGYSAGVPSLIDLALGSFIPDDALPKIILPVALGLEVDAIVWQPDQDQEWLGAHIILTTENIEAFPLSGCSASDIGCGSSGPVIDIELDEVLGCNDLQFGCEGGSCSQGGTVRLPAGRILGIFSMALVCLLRRRE